MSAYKQFTTKDIVITPFSANKGFSFKGNAMTASNVGIEIYYGKDGIIKLLEQEADLVIFALSGIEAIYPLLFALERGLNIAIANKYVSKEVPVGSSVEVTTHMKQYLTLLVAPTMRVPKDVSKTNNAYLHMIAVLEHVYGYRNPSTISVVMTAPCAGYGNMSPEIIAKQMRMAWQAVHRETDLHFDDIYRSDEELYYL